KQLQIVATPSLVKTAVFPSCFKLTSSFINTLQHHLKNATSNSEYHQLHNEILDHHQIGWDVLYTDGSKSNTGTAFPVTNILGATIAAYSLPSYCSAFTAVAAALLEA
ncbi:unnamed protein product, partial [Ceratitis capitata]